MKQPKTHKLARLSLSVILCIALGLLPACAGAEQAAGSVAEGAGASSQASEAPQAVESLKPSSGPVEGGVLNIASAQSPATLDPLRFAGYNAFVTTQQIGDTLVIPDEKGAEFLPCLANSWTVSEDGLQWVFQLRDDVHFQKGQYQDGRLMTAEDVAYSILRNKQHVNNTLSFVADVQATGDLEVTFTLSEPNATLLFELTMAYYIIVPQEEVDGWGDEFGNHLIATGPFKLDKFEQDVEFVLSRNEDYWGNRPYLDGVTFKVITNETQRINALTAGEIDVVISVSNDALPDVSSNPDLVLVQTGDTQLHNFQFNMEDPILSNPQVREALIMATNRDDLVAAAFDGVGVERTKVPLFRNSWAYEESVQDYAPDYDPEAAKALLAEAGYPDGFEVTISYASNVYRERIAVVLQQQWQQTLGVTLNIDGAELATYNDKVHTGGGQIYLGGSTSTTGDPNIAVGYAFDSAKKHSSYNPGGYENSQVDALVREAIKETDLAARGQLYRQILETAMADYPGVWIAEQHPYWAFRDGVYMENVGNWFHVTGGEYYNSWKE